MALAWLVYHGLVALVVWTALVPASLLRIAVGRGTWRELQEWLGRNRLSPAAGTRLVVHAVSAGEVSAAAALIEALGRARPLWTVVLTCGTRDGRVRAHQLRQRLPGIEAVCYLPWDRARAVSRWLRHIDPAGFVVVEPEFWPNVYRACGRLSIPLIVVNARVYPRDVARYRLIRPFMREPLHVPMAFAARTASDVEALGLIGGPLERVSVVGDVKVDAAAGSWRESVSGGRAPGGRAYPILIAGSTHAPEEDVVLDVLRRVRVRHPALRLVLAPRHVRRARRLARACRTRGHLVAYSSGGVDLTGEWDVLIVDRFGALASLYPAADIALVGGTLARRGGHNVLEPAIAGCAIIVGRHVEHVSHHVEALAAAGGIVRLTGGDDELAAAVERLLDDTDARSRLSTHARAYVEGHLGAAGRCATIVLSAVETQGGAGDSLPVLPAPPAFQPLLRQTPRCPQQQ